MLTLGQLDGFWVGGGMQIQPGGSFTTNSSFTGSITFSGVSIIPGGNFLVIAAGIEATVGTAASVTCKINTTVATTRVVTGISSSTVDSSASIFIVAMDPSWGSSVNITFAGAPNVGQIGGQAYTLVAASSGTADNTATGTGSLSIGINGGGGVIVAGYTQAGGGNAATWSSPLTKDHDQIHVNFSDSEAHAQQLNAQTLSVSVTWSNSLGLQAMAAASYH